MATVKEHYAGLLADVYSWMSGGFDSAVHRNADFFRNRQIMPWGSGSGVALDLGAGCGFQSIPLAEAGYQVIAVDQDEKLLDELREHLGDLSIVVIQDDLLHFDRHRKDNIEVVVCMTDTLLHLESEEKVVALFAKVFAALEPDGRFVITFRELIHELTELERFLPVRSDENMIFTCFLEYEPETVKVHDIVYEKTDEQWTFRKSFYRKLRLSGAWVRQQLVACGFRNVEAETERGCVTLVAVK